MDSPDSFQTIKSPSKIEIKIKGSKFIGQAIPCADEAEAEELLEAVRREYYDATHNCFAYRVGIGRGERFRYSDAGEPSGTAGKPIYDQIEGKSLSDLAVIVTRYFGGTKLGTGGLTHAYSESAAKAIEQAGIIEKFITEEISMTVQFPDYSVVERAVHQHDGRVIDSEFSDVVRLKIEIRRSSTDRLKDKLINITSGRVAFE
jgi:uncharacterized YigZ family protein